jgi:3-oxoacyl-[acyl-carrier protein] reductase
MHIPSTKLEGKRALICGASEGIGRATAILFAANGAQVTALARSQAKLEALMPELAKPSGGKHNWLCADVNLHGELRAHLEKEIHQHGPFDILVNNTGGPKGGPIAEAQAEEFIGAFHQHLLTNQLLTQLLLPGMKTRGYGRIINVISTSVRVPIPGLGVSNTIRGAVASWAKTLSLEVAAHGITVNSILPGYTRTGRLDGLLSTTSQKTGKSISQIEEEWKATIPARRFAEPEEVAAAIAFFASPAASYINGTTLAVDGGRLPAL